MKRPKFFEDLDRSLSGEPEPTPEPDTGGRELAAATQAVHERMARVEAALLHAIRNTTATGALIAAQQQRHAQYSDLGALGAFTNVAPTWIVPFPFD